MIEVLRANPLTTVQDLGRPGLAHLGVGRSGAADRGSLRLANRLVGNAEGAACLEITLGGFAARFTEPGVVALAGAPAAVRVCGRDAAMHRPIEVQAGDELRVAAPKKGLRTYLAVRGGLDVTPVLGSRSTDVLAGLGPGPVLPGTRLAVGDDIAGPPVQDVAAVTTFEDDIVLRALPGPRDDWFTAAAHAALTSQPYQVTPQSNRVGLRLSGAELKRAVSAELPPEGMVPGAVQVPPNGQPVLFLADHPVTGGYPVIAVVLAVDVCLAAQARPGQWLRFRFVAPPAAGH